MNRRTERSVELLERRLLHAARLERPDAAARRRAALALAGGALVGSASTNAAAAVATAGMKATGGTAVVAASGGVTSSAVAATAATSVGVVKLVTGAAMFAGIGKAVAIGAISGAVVLGASQTLQPSGLRQTPSAGTVATAGTPIVSGPRPDLAHLTPGPPPAVPPLAQAPEIETTTPSKVIGPRVTPKASALAGEIAVIDRAREALMAGDSERTLAIVDDYERTRTAPRLAVEAAVLRIEALSQQGERTRAAALASAFLRDHPQSPVADRMRAIVDATSK